jgi:hypothetical protein
MLLKINDSKIVWNFKGLFIKLVLFIILLEREDYEEIEEIDLSSIDMSLVKEIEIIFKNPPPIYRYEVEKHPLVLRYLGIYGNFEGLFYFFI